MAGCAATFTPRTSARRLAIEPRHGAVKAAYARTDRFERRRALMDAWAAYLPG